MHDLLSIWISNLRPSLELTRSQAAKTGKLDDSINQASFEFDQPPNVIFVTDKITKTIAKYYSDLPTIPLSKEEQLIVNNLVSELTLLSNNFYDGDQLLVTGVAYDQTINTVYLEVKQAKFSFLRALGLKRFSEGSALYQLQIYKTGILVPFMTRNDHTVFIERTNDKLYSVASGFMEPFGKKKRLHLQNPNMVIRTAVKEALEEFLQDQKTGKFRVRFSMPQIKSLSFRQGGSLGTIEFIAPCIVDCHVDYLAHMITHNTAKDAEEHTDRYVIIPLDSNEREKVTIDFLKPGAAKYPGGFLCHPLLVSTSFFTNRLERTTPQRLPYSRTQVMLVSQFFPNPQKTLQWKKAPDDDNLSQKNTANEVDSINLKK